MTTKGTGAAGMPGVEPADDPCYAHAAAQRGP